MRRALKLRIATRNSQLALWQTDFVIAALKQVYPQINCEKIELLTQGDKDLSSPLAKIGGKGLFLKELELALLNNEADIAVHSLKDVPAQQTPGLALITFLTRENPEDVLLTRDARTLAQLPPGARIGTSSLRRVSQLKALRPDLDYQWLRGNVPTRIKKLIQGEYEAIVLAFAGLIRLQLTDLISERLTSAQCLPAVGQGVIVIQARTNDAATQAYCAPLDDPRTRICIEAERAMHARLGGSCQTPIAGLATIKGEHVELHALVGAPDGSEIIREQQSGIAQFASQIGVQVAERLLARGAD
ncbi:MAG TPA: hydroxymethylbilane synthase, partial [Gammaproteobacteria bacterium]|nr:hydroxymethylbilane synthase [Gammaproteobacteria bacterium]